MKAFCEHYGKTGLVENMLLGISGNYGEAIYAASAGTGWTADVHGPYHSHFGYWAGDPFAIADFKAYIVRKYGSPAAMQAAWGAKSPATFDAVQPFLQADAVSDRAWVDMMDWYQSSMTDWTTFWLKQTRKYFPKGGIEVCTGGDAAPQLGSNFAAQCRAAASVGGGIRITNEGSDYWVNYVVTRWIASASRQYGAFFSFEPAGAVNADGVVARIYNATASGALGLHYYYGNIFDEREATQAFIDQGSHFLQRNPIVEMGVYYPETFIELRGEKFLGKLMPLRDRFDFAYMSDTQIADGGLAGIKTLVLVDGNIAEAGTWQRIAQWVRQGGVLVYPGGMGTLKTVEGGDAPINAMLAMGGATGRGRVYRFEGLGSSTQYRQFVTQSLATAPELSLATRAMLAQDGVEDRVYATVVAPDELLWFNATHDPVTKQVGAGTLVLPAMAITGEKLQLK